MKMTDDDDCDRVEGDQDAKGAEDENKRVRDQDKKCVEDHGKGAEDQDKKGNENLLNDIAVMQKVGIIEKSTCRTLQKTHKCTDNCTVPLYTKIDCNEKQQQKFSPFVEVNQNGRVCHIHKTTAVWLF